MTRTAGASPAAPLLLKAKAARRGIAEKQNQKAHLGKERAIMENGFSLISLQ